MMMMVAMEMVQNEKQCEMVNTTGMDIILF